jgi:hypothetical protein
MIQIIILMLVGCCLTVALYFAAYSIKKRKRAKAIDRRHKSDMQRVEREVRRRTYQL